VKSLAQTETDLSSEDIKDPSTKASLVGENFSPTSGKMVAGRWLKKLYEEAKKVFMTLEK
jgi:hypothetical protein